MVNDYFRRYFTHQSTVNKSQQNNCCTVEKIKIGAVFVDFVDFCYFLLPTFPVLLDHQLHITDWPAISPDMNPIENAWGYLVHHVYKDGKQYYSLNDLREAQDWDGVAQDFIKKLIDSMPKEWQRL